MKLEGMKINFLGDSITQGHGVSDPQKLTWRQRDPNCTTDGSVFGYACL